MEEFLHPSDDLNEPLPPESQALLDRFKAYAVWHPRLLQVRTRVLDTVWEPADVVFVVVCGPICQRSLPNNPILLLSRRRRPPIRRHASRRDISASHLPIEIKWEQCNRREKPPIVHSQDQSNWRQLVGWNRKSKKCNAQRAVR